MQRGIGGLASSRSSDLLRHKILNTNSSKRMATLELHCGPEPRSCVWGGDRADLIDSFDSEMQEWEDQLQDMQRKIEELYSEVKARRGASESSKNNGTNNKSLDITLLPVNSQYSHQANGYPETHGHPNNNLPIRQCNEVRSDHTVMQSLGFHHPSDCYNGSNNYTLNSLRNDSHYPASCHDLERQDATLDILNGYLQQGPCFEKNLGNLVTPNANPKVYPVTHSYQDSMKTSLVTNRTASCVVLDAFEEAENKNNKKSSWDDSQARHVSWKDPVSSNELPPKSSVSKLAIRQRDASPVTPRSTYHESSQQHERKCLLLDRKSGSPSVLRKFGAMLQENEGKTLIEDGLVTTVVSTEPPRHTSTPANGQNKFDAKRASTRAPVHKCLADCDVLAAELESSQEPWAAGPSKHLLNGDRDCGRGGSTLEQYGLAYNLSPSQSPLKSKFHKAPPGPKNHKASFQSENLFSDYQMVERILAAESQNFSKIHTGLGADTMRQGNDNLEKLLERMEIENNKSQRATFTQQLDTKQVNHESSAAQSSSNFSRPARPANQRRPSRWANHTPSSKITHTSCPPSPGLKTKQFLNSYSRHTETVIM